MGKYLILQSYDFSKEHCWIVEAPTKKKALQIFSKFYCKKDELFLESLADRCVNMSFAEKFWIQTQEEEKHFSRTGEILIDRKEFAIRVKKYFSKNPEFAQEYLNFYFSEASIDTLSDDFLFYVWISDLDDKDFTIMNIEEITHL